jgi:hypothetical protein
MLAKVKGVNYRTVPDTPLASPKRMFTRPEATMKVYQQTSEDHSIKLLLSCYQMLPSPPWRIDLRLILKGLESRPGLRPGTCRLRHYYFLVAHLILNRLFTTSHWECGGRTRGKWSRRRDLNSRPRDYESRALPTELLRPMSGT